MADEKNRPQWWSKIVKDIERTCESSRRSFTTPSVVIGTTEDEIAKITGYIVRLNNGEAGYYPVGGALKGKHIPVGARIKSTLPEPEFLVKDPERSSFILKTIKEQVKLVPVLWLNRTIKAICEGRRDQIDGYDKMFHEWVKVPKTTRKNRQAMNAILKAVEWQGLKGLARYNDVTDIK
jgi:hypothetical protein